MIFNQRRKEFLKRNEITIVETRFIAEHRDAIISKVAYNCGTRNTSKDMSCISTEVSSKEVWRQEKYAVYT